MKKNGFTLAEVLITLSIIGVVASMTLPALMTNTQEQTAKTGIKKGINTLTEAAQMSEAIDGFNYASVLTTETNDASDTAQSLYALLARRTSMDFAKSKKADEAGMRVNGGTASGSNFAVFFRDGSVLMFPTEAAKVGGKSGAQNTETMMDDGLPYGITAIYDINGLKGPNIVSNCKGTAAGVDSDSTAADYNTECTSQKRVIKDQFGVRLRGSYAVPNGAAARWAYNN